MVTLPWVHVLRYNITSTMLRVHTNVFMKVLLVLYQLGNYYGRYSGGGVWCSLCQLCTATGHSVKILNIRLHEAEQGVLFEGEAIGGTCYSSCAKEEKEKKLCNI